MKSKYTKAQRQDFYKKASELIVPEMCAFKFACRCLYYVVNNNDPINKFDEEFLLDFPELLLFNPHDELNDMPWWLDGVHHNHSVKQAAESRRIALLLSAEMCK